MQPSVPVLWQDGKDNRGWPVVCVPPGLAAEIIVTIEVCERTGREKKIERGKAGGRAAQSLREPGSGRARRVGG